MIKLLFVHSSLRYVGGAERALVNILGHLPANRYAIDLQLFDGEGPLFDEIPASVNILPPLLQFSKWTPELPGMLRARGDGHMAEVRERVRRRNLALLAAGKSEYENQEANWADLRTICPAYGGYDTAVAFSEGLPLKITAEQVGAQKKVAWMHFDPASNPLPTDYQLSYLRAMDAIAFFAHQNVASMGRLHPEFAHAARYVPYLHTPAMEQLAGAYAPDEFVKAEDGALCIFTAGRHCEQKGIDFIIGAAALLQKRNRKFCWVVLGQEWDTSDYYRQKIFELGLESKVMLKAAVKNPYPYFSNCDIYVQPSRFEGKCIALEEARISGCPLVATSFSSVRDIIRSEKNGLVCDMDAASLADAVERLMLDVELRGEMARTNKEMGCDGGVSDYLALLG